MSLDKITATDLVAAITKYNTTPADEMEIVGSYHVVCYIAANFTGMSLPTIGRSLKRDHTTILYGRDKIAHMRTINPGLDQDIKTLLEVLGYGDDAQESGAGTTHDSGEAPTSPLQA